LTKERRRAGKKKRLAESLKRWGNLEDLHTNAERLKNLFNN